MSIHFRTTLHVVSTFEYTWTGTKAMINAMSKVLRRWDSISRVSGVCDKLKFLLNWVESLRRSSQSMTMTMTKHEFSINNRGGHKCGSETFLATFICSRQANHNFNQISWSDGTSAEYRNRSQLIYKHAQQAEKHLRSRQSSLERRKSQINRDEKSRINAISGVPDNSSQLRFTMALMR